MWVQCYDPLGNWPASTLAAAVPVFVLLGLLAWGRLNAAGAALAGLSAAWIMAFFHLAGLVGSCTHRLGYLEQRPVRQSSKDHRHQASARPGPDGLGELDRWRDGKDDRRPVHRGGSRGDRRGGREGELLRAVLWHSLALALIVGLIVWVYAHILPAVIVSAPSTLP